MVTTGIPDNSQPAVTERTRGNPDYPDSVVTRTGWLEARKSTARARAKNPRWRHRLTQHEKLILAECQQLVDDGVAFWADEAEPWTAAELFGLCEIDVPVSVLPFCASGAPTACVGGLVTIPSATAFGEPLLDAQQLTDVLGMTRRWVYAQVEENGLPAYKLGRSLAFEVSAVRAWLATRRVGDWPAVSV